MNVVADAAVTVRRTIAAPAEALFDAWLDADALAVWMRPGDTTCSTATIDARVGGAFEILMHTPGGTVPHRGRYVAIERPRRLVFTWNSPYAGEHDSRVTVDFRAAGAATEVVITHERLPLEHAEAHRGGWNDALESLATHRERVVALGR
jgi:uncharacterized protein YndB with AHSA1/START domain